MAKKVQASKVCAFLYICAKPESNVFILATNHTVTVVRQPKKYKFHPKVAKY